MCACLFYEDREKVLSLRESVRGKEAVRQKCGVGGAAVECVWEGREGGGRREGGTGGGGKGGGRRGEGGKLNERAREYKDLSYHESCS